MKMIKFFKLLGLAALLIVGTGAMGYAAMNKNEIMAYKSNQLIGTPVWTEDGLAAGNVHNLIIDESGRVVFVILHQVGNESLGGERYVAVPFSALKFSKQSPGETTVYLNVTKDELQRVQAFDPNSDVISQEWAAQDYGRFGQAPYWGEAGISPRQAWWQKDDEYVRNFGGGGGAP